MIRKYLRWDDGYVMFELRDSEYLLLFANNTILFRPRSIFVEKNVAGNKIVYSKKKRYVYVIFSKHLLPYSEFGKKAVDEYIDYQIEVRYTRLKYGNYLTINLPGAYLYDHVILTDDQMCIIISAKRNAYFERTDDGLTIYLV